ncbi:MAG: glutamine--fructose-6-phosphate transaminase (isomerizing) [Clostridiales bacterium]|nr:glutamine--fructose-6-phosphate transaminase (isomerizing) [Clostridiales bacterium]
MCGIVGYTGRDNATPILMEGLDTLAYRGYDSAGIAVWNGEDIVMKKEKGQLSNLKAILDREPVTGSCGIGHTRWATHGEPSYINSHPHGDTKKQLVLVHNGIIENYVRLKNMLVERGCKFVSDTDTEVVAQLLGEVYEGDPLAAITNAIRLLEGSFALAILFRDDPTRIYCVCKDSPMVVGFGKDGAHIASDIPALLSYTRDVTFMGDKQIAVLSPVGIAFYDEFGTPIDKGCTHIDWDLDAAKKGSYEHYMMKEICEEPVAFRKTAEQYVSFREQPKLKADCFPWSDEDAKTVKRIRIIGCGTAYHAGLLGKKYFQELAKIPVEAEIASEFRYSDYVFEEGEVLFLISQSGETADTIAALRMAKQAGIRTVAVCNVIGSTIAREADEVLFTFAGPEIAVAATKSYLTQVTVLFLTAMRLGLIRGTVSEERAASLLSELADIPQKMQRLIDERGEIQYFASREFSARHVFFIGRGIDNALSMEAALKLKEVSYIHSEAYAAGELKHGTIALIEEGTLVVGILTQRKLAAKTASNLEEVRVRGANVLALTNGELPDIASHCSKVWKFEETNELLAPFLAIIPMQLFAYYMAVQKGCNVDKPRNLAKSVTVE